MAFIFFQMGNIGNWTADTFTPVVVALQQEKQAMVVAIQKEPSSQKDPGSHKEPAVYKESAVQKEPAAQKEKVNFKLLQEYNSTVANKIKPGDTILIVGAAQTGKTKWLQELHLCLSKTRQMVWILEDFVGETEGLEQIQDIAQKQGAILIVSAQTLKAVSQPFRNSVRWIGFTSIPSDLDSHARGDELRKVLAPLPGLSFSDMIPRLICLY